MRQPGPIQDVVFFSHVPQVKWYSNLAADLRERLSLRTTLWVVDDGDAAAGQKTGSFDRVVNLAEGWRGRETPKSTAADTAYIVGLEARLGESCYHRDVALDRYIEAKGWGAGRIASYAAHVGRAVEQELETLRLWAAFGEANCLARRIAYRIVSEQAPYITLVGLSIFEDRFYVETTLDWNWSGCHAQYDRFREHGLPPEARDAAEQAITGITQHYQQPGSYARSTRGPAEILTKCSAQRASQEARRYMRMLRRDSRLSVRQFGWRTEFPLTRLLRAVSVRRCARAYDRMVERALPAGQSFGCYFMHYQPEYTTEGLASHFRNQFALIRTIAESLPADMTLLVKEHRPMVGLRRLEEYRGLLRIPNVTLVSDRIPSHDIVRQADAVFTLTGTVGLEAMCFGTPAIAFGDIFFANAEGRCFPGIHKVRQLSELPDVIRRARARRSLTRREDVRAALGAMYAASWPGRFNGSFTMEEMSTVENRERVVVAVEAEVAALRTAEVASSGGLPVGNQRRRERWAQDVFDARR